MNRSRSINRLNATEETYIETIATLLKMQGYAKVTDIAKTLKVMPSSVSEMLKKLSGLGFVNHNPYGPVTLTKKGYALNEYLEEQQLSLQRFFELLGIDKRIAKEDACRIEHVLNEVTLERLSLYVNFIENTYHSLDCIVSFKQYIKNANLQ
jgi:DtxR family Mn-dependent transcriptional regulator